MPHAIDPMGPTIGAMPWESDPIVGQAQAVNPWDNDPIVEVEPDDLLARERRIKSEGSFQNTELSAPPEGAVAQDIAQGYSNVRSFGESAAAELAKALGIGMEVLQPFQAVMRGTMPKAPGETYNQFLTFLKSYGYPTDDVENVAGRLGVNMVDNIIFTLMGVGAGRAAMGAVKGPGGVVPDPSDLGFGQRLTRNFGVGMSQAPAEQLGAAVTGSVGQTIGQTESGDDPMAGMVGYGLTAFPGANVARMGESIARKGYGLFSNKHPSEALFPMDPLLPAATAQQRVDAHTAYIEKELHKVINNHRPFKTVRGKKVPLTPQEADDMLQASVDDVYEKTRQIEDTYWEAVNPGQMVVTDDIKSQVMAAHERLMFEESARVLPEEFIEEIRELPAVVPASKVLSITRNIYGARKMMQRNPTFMGSRERAAQLLGDLEDQVREGLAKEVQNPQALADARAFTSERKSLFNEGPLGAARYADRVKGEEYTKPLTEQVMGRIGGAQQMLDIDRFAKGQGITSTLVDDFENSLRSIFAESQVGRQGTQMPDPNAAQRWIDKNAENLKPIRNLLQDFDNEVDNLTQLQAMHDRALKSVWANYAKHPQSAPNLIVTQNNPNMVADTIEATRMFYDPKTSNLARGQINVADPAGLRAWQTQVVQQLGKMVQHEPQRLSELVARPDIQQMLAGVFRTNPEVMARYLRLVKAAATEDINRAGVPTSARMVGVLLARLAGASVGRRVSPGTIQGPAMISDAFKRGITGYLNRRFPAAPSDILSWAMFSPEGERWLMSRVPQNIPELRRSIIMARRIQGVFNTGFGELFHRRDPDGRQWYSDDSTPPQ